MQPSNTQKDVSSSEQSGVAPTDFHLSQHSVAENESVTFLKPRSLGRVAKVVFWYHVVIAVLSLFIFIESISGSNTHDPGAGVATVFSFLVLVTCVLVALAVWFSAKPKS